MQDIEKGLQKNNTESSSKSLGDKSASDVPKFLLEYVSA